MSPFVYAKLMITDFDAEKIPLISGRQTILGKDYPSPTLQPPGTKNKG